MSNGYRSNGNQYGYNESGSPKDQYGDSIILPNCRKATDFENQLIQIKNNTGLFPYQEPNRICNPNSSYLDNDNLNFTDANGDNLGEQIGQGVDPTESDMRIASRGWRAGFVRP